MYSNESNKNIEKRRKEKKKVLNFNKAKYINNVGDFIVTQGKCNL